MDAKRTGWLAALRRECGIRRGILLHGNVGDVVADEASNQWLPYVSAVAATLKSRGFQHVVTWDRYEGPRGVDARTWQTLRETCAGPAARPAGAEDYDMGDSASSGSEPNRIAPPATPPALAGQSAPDPLDFFAVVTHHLRNDGNQRVAFVVDWSHYLFGNANALSEVERTWLIMLGKAARDASLSLDPSEIKRPGNLLVLVAPRLTSLPPSLYQQNPAFKEIAVPIPSRAERETALRRLSTQLNLVEPLTPATRPFADLVDALDGFTLRDLHQLVRLSRQIDPTTPDKLVNLYRYGESNSPWEGLNRGKLESLGPTLRKRVIGQDEAIASVSHVIVRAYTGLSGLQHSRRQRTPKGVLFFVGPTGVGKTELAKSLAQFLFGDEEACLRFDMSEFNHEHADQRLIGAPPGYVGYEEGGQLTNAVKRRPFSVVLFDEIEKAHPRILDKFLQILEDGRLTDGKGDTVSFSETVIVFTSNIGAATVRNCDDPVAARGEFINAVHDHFVSTLGRPELLGRIGNNIVPFNFVVDQGFLLSIARVKLNPLRELLAEKYGIRELVFANEDRALGAVLSEVDTSKGGRGVLNALVTHLFDPLSRFLFEEVAEPRDSEGKTLKVLQAGSGPSFLFKFES